MAHLITILRLVGGAWITEWQHRATGSALKFATSGHCYYVCACMERHLGKPSQSLDKRLLKVQTLQTPHLTHPTPLPLLLLHPHRG